MPRVTGSTQATREQRLANALREVLKTVNCHLAHDTPATEVLAAAEAYLRQRERGPLLYYDHVGNGVYDNDIPF